MKILIITYYKENNPGTFLQAYGVQYAWKQKYPNAQIEFFNYSSINKDFVNDGQLQNPHMSFFQKILHVLYLKKRSKLFAASQAKCFAKGVPAMSLFPNDKEYKDILDYLNQFDVISVGSDTILEQIDVNGNIGLMWLPREVRAQKVFFAGSGDSCKLLHNKEEYYTELRERVIAYKYIGIRDNVTIDFLHKQLGIELSSITKQPDPTFFLPLNLFTLPESKIKRIPKDKKVIFYHFDRRFIYRKQLAKMLKTQGYFLFTTEYDPDVDLSFGALTPFEFAAVFKYCDYVITERFHDTVFSMRWNTPVITIDWRKTVVNDNGESKRLSILKDFDSSDCHLQLFDETSLPGVLEKLELLDVVSFKRRSSAKVADMQALCKDIMSKL